MGEPDAVHTAALAEHEFAGEKCEHSVADPCGFAFNFEGFVAGHARSLRLVKRVGESFQTLAGDSFTQTILRLRVPVTGLQLKEDRGKTGRTKDLLRKKKIHIFN